MTAEDRHWMQQAMALAARGRGSVEPNPMVGAVVVRDGLLIGSGWHQRYGQAHAEVNALAEAGEGARGATLYVTLEPCCHHGKTPPCTDAVLRAGIRRVVAAMSDPFPAVAGRGAAILRAAGIEVEVGVCADEARRLNAPYLQLVRTGRPWVHTKWAMTLDGKIAARTGHSQWISNETSRRRVHELRGRVDAIVCGIGTVLADDPQLTARPPGPRTACRVVLDHLGRIPDTCHLVRTAREIPTLVVTGPLTEDNRRRLESQGVELLTPLPPVLGGEGTGVGAFSSASGSPKREREGHLIQPNTPLACASGFQKNTSPSLPRSTEGEGVGVSSLLAEMGRRRWTNILIEGGSAVLGSFLDARLIDEFHIFVAPKLVGGREALSAVGGFGVERMDEALSLAEMTVELSDGDWYIHGMAANAIHQRDTAAGDGGDSATPSDRQS